MSLRVFQVQICASSYQHLDRLHMLSSYRKVQRAGYFLSLVVDCRPLIKEQLAELSAPI